MEESGSFNQSPFTSSPSGSGSTAKGSKAKKIIFLVIILLILGALAYGATVLLGGSSDDASDTAETEFIIPTDEPTPTEEITPTEEVDEDATPTPTTKTTPTPTKAATSGNSVDSTTGLDRSALSIVVQNGSGEAGVAKVMADKLVALGYKISSTGNADNFEYESTVIRVKAANSKYLPLLKKDLGDDYTVGTATSDYTGTGDAVVIIGKE